MENRKLSYKMKINKYIFECVHAYYDEKLSEFVAERYYNSDGFKFEYSLDELKKHMKEEDKKYIDEAYVYTVYDEGGTILGTIRKILKLSNKELPIEKEFDINLAKFRKDYNKVYEIARFTIRDSSPRVLQILLKEALSQYNDDILVVASLDAKVLNGLKRIGFDWKQVKKSRIYLGSESVPVILEKGTINNRIARK